MVSFAFLHPLHTVVLRNPCYNVVGCSQPPSRVLSYRLAACKRTTTPGSYSLPHHCSRIPYRRARYTHPLSAGSSQRGPARPFPSTAFRSDPGCSATATAHTIPLRPISAPYTGAFLGCRESAGAHVMPTTLLCCSSSHHISARAAGTYLTVCSVGIHGVRTQQETGWPSLACATTDRLSCRAASPPDACRGSSAPTASAISTSTPASARTRQSRSCK